MKKWLAMFSKTGGELQEIINQVGVCPDLILVNHNKPVNIDCEVVRIDNKPDVSVYDSYFKQFDIITLHGYMRIIPPEVCSYNIYNGHPGLITKYEILRGKDPQEKAFNLKLPTSGCVIHKVTPEVDNGEILMADECNIDGLTLDDVIIKLRDVSIRQWVKFLKSALK